jgi:murein L,D-transpeptidase YcbB/YkuD
MDMRRMSSSVRLTAFAAALACVAPLACKKANRAAGEVSRNWMPAQQQAYMGVSAADVQTAIKARLATAPPAPLTADEWRHVKSLYTRFNQRLLWLDDKGVQQPRVSALLNAIANADSDAMRLDAYPVTDLAPALHAVNDKHATAEQLANADVLLSSVYAAFGENMLTGQLDPSALNQSWHISRREERIDSALALTLRTDDFSAGLTRMRPQDPMYDSLRVVYAKYRDLVSRGGWQPVPDGKPLKRGVADSPARLTALRARLAAEGYLADTTAAPADSANTKATSTRTSPRAVYDQQLAAAVADFQARHGIVVDSMLGKETLDAMNVPPMYRLAQIAANLERYRWMPRDLGTRYILVNVPQFYLHAFDSGQKVLDMKVIVGQEYQEKATPVFSDSMEFVVFRPYWNVTPGIAEKEIFPKEASNPGYLAANNMEVYNDHGRRAVRQLPGPKNSLGLVKFMFPNDFNIYLHDTPNDELFKKDIRAFSHGCIRLEKPAELAQWVLGWPADRVQQAMQGGGNNKQVNLPSKIPVYIVYFTAFVQNGRLAFGNDLYERDSKVVSEMVNVAVPSEAVKQAQDALRALAKS